MRCKMIFNETMTSFSLAKTQPLILFLDRLELMHDEHSFSLYGCCYKCCRNVKLRTRCTKWKAAKKGEDAVGMLSAQGQGEQVFLLGGVWGCKKKKKKRTGHSQKTPPGQMVNILIYNFKICNQKNKQKLRILDDFGGPFRKRADGVDIKQKAERHCIHNLILVSPYEQTIREMILIFSFS